MIILACLLMLIVSFGLEWLQKVQGEQQTIRTMQDENSIDESEQEAGRSQKVILENEQMVCYEDRAFELFSYQQEEIDHMAAVTKGVLERCPALEQVYVMPVAPRSIIESGYSGYEEQKSAYQRYLKVLSQKLPLKSKMLDVSEALLQHKEEYVFYRTEESWTTRGAYYGAEVFLSEIGREPIPLEQYEEYVYSSFLGDMKYREDIAKIEEETLCFTEDQVYYYALEGTSQRAEVKKEDDNGVTINYKKPLYTPSTRNLSAIIDGDYIEAIVEGDTVDTLNTDNHLLVICDGAGKLLVPYLKDYYDGIYVVNVYEKENLFQDLPKILDQYHIAEVLIAQKASHMGEKTYQRALSDFNKESVIE